MAQIALITDAPFCEDVRAQRVHRVLTSEGFEVGVFDQGFSVDATREIINPTFHFPSDIPSGGIAKTWWHIKNRLFSLGAHQKRMRTRVADLQQFNPDAIWCANVFDLEAAAYVAKANDIPLIYEAYEYWPEHLISDEYRLPLAVAFHLQSIELECAPFINAFVTVSLTLGQWYSESCDMPQPAIVYNAHIPDEAFECDGKTLSQSLQLIHSGQTSINRNVEVAIKAMDALEDVELTVLGYGSGFDTLKGKQSSYTAFKEAVPHDELIAELSRYDIGLILTDGSALQTDGALPNKLFDYMGAGLGVIAVRTAALDSLENIASFTRFIDAPTVEDFTEAVEELTHNRERVSQMRSAALRESKKYTEDMIDKVVLDVVKDACG